MIQTEILIINNKRFIHTYSDNNMIIYGGMPKANYSEAIDPEELERTYIETNIPVEVNSEWQTH